MEFQYLIMHCDIYSELSAQCNYFSYFSSRDSSLRGRLESGLSFLESLTQVYFTEEWYEYDYDPQNSEHAHCVSVYEAG